MVNNNSSNSKNKFNRPAYCALSNLDCSKSQANNAKSFLAVCCFHIFWNHKIGVFYNVKQLVITEFVKVNSIKIQRFPVLWQFIRLKAIFVCNINFSKFELTTICNMSPYIL